MKAFPKPERQLRLGMVGGGRGALIGPVHAMGARLDNRWRVVAGCLSSDPAVARESGADWFLPPERVYTDYREMARREAERMRASGDGIDAVAITTPNNSHHVIARVFLDTGIDVICDKPLTNDLADALDLVEATRRTGLVFGVTHAFAAYPLVRQAKEMIAAGELGRLRQVNVEYLQDWKTEDTSLAPTKQSAWRGDPALSGRTACTGDIGTHAHHLATFVTGRRMTRLRAELLTTGPPGPLDDTVHMMVRYEGDVPGMLWCTQVAPGNGCGLRLRVYGDKAGLEWDQEAPEALRFARFGEPARIVSRGFGAGIGAYAERLTRVPRDVPEGWIEAWANLYTEFAVAIEARRDGREIDRGMLQYPTVEDGALGVKFIEAALESDAADGAWVDTTLAL